jgi:hypothetical protein
MRGLNLDQLHTFVEAIERGSFSAAADRLDLTQPAVSLQVRQLEKRLGVRPIDDRQHLPPGAGRAACYELDEQRLADSAAGHALAHIDGILDREAIGRSWPIGAGIAVARDLALQLGHEIWQAELQDRRAARADLFHRRRLLFEGSKAVSHMMGVDRLDGGQVRFRGVAHNDARHVTTPRTRPSAAAIARTGHPSPCTGAAAFA